MYTNVHIWRKNSHPGPRHTVWYTTAHHSVARSPSRAPVELRETVWSPGHLKDKQWPGARETARRLIHHFPLLSDRLE